MSRGGVTRRSCRSTAVSGSVTPHTSATCVPGRRRRRATALATLSLGAVLAAGSPGIAAAAPTTPVRTFGAIPPNYRLDAQTGMANLAAAAEADGGQVRTEATLAASVDLTSWAVTPGDQGSHGAGATRSATSGASPRRPRRPTPRCTSSTRTRAWSPARTRASPRRTAAPSPAPPSGSPAGPWSSTPTSDSPGPSIDAGPSRSPGRPSVVSRYQRSQCTTSSKGRRSGLRIGRNGRSAGYPRPIMTTAK
ncbi:MAG: hypothetical protein JWP40_589 [Blastococcus sp.]|nr:hypothetical protein [Blastococcus sp.]